MDEKKRDDIVRKITVMLLEGKTHHRVMTLLGEEGFAREEIKQAIPHLKIEDYKTFLEYFKEEAGEEKLEVSTSTEPQLPVDQLPSETTHEMSNEEIAKLEKEMTVTEKKIEAVEAVQTTEQNDIHRVEKKIESRGKNLFGRIFSFAVLVGLLIFLFWVQTLTSANLFIILIGFLPFILIIILTTLAIEHYGTDMVSYLWVVGIALVIIFFFVLDSAQSPMLQNLDYRELTAINSVGIIIFLGFISMTWSRELILSSERRKKMKKNQESAQALREESATHQVTEEWHKPGSEGFKETVHSIEDKCKAINFTIGRVYGERHGGTNEMREKIRISSDLYNQFSTLVNIATEEDRSLLLDILSQIKQRLLTLEKTEHEVFGSAIATLKNLKHDDEGEDSVLTVLGENDKDPIQHYHESALNFCDHAISSLDRK